MERSRRWVSGLLVAGLMLAPGCVSTSAGNLCSQRAEGWLHVLGLPKAPRYATATASNSAPAGCPSVNDASLGDLSALSDGMAVDSLPDGEQWTTAQVYQTMKTQADVLFMVDNSQSMDAMNQELRNRFGQFFQAFQTLAHAGTFVDLHIGVVSSDFGAGATGAPAAGRTARRIPTVRRARAS